MNRIVIARNLYQHNLNNFTLSNSNAVKRTALTEVKCSFCREFLFKRLNKENVLQVRHQSTRTASTASAPSLSKKKTTKHKKKYAELLQVDGKSMTETKISINKLHAAHLSKLAASPVSLSQLHQLTTNTANKKEVTTKNVDTELLQTVKSKLLNGNPKCKTTLVPLEDDLWALIYTNVNFSNFLQDKIKPKEYLSMAKESYYNFQKATLYQNKLKDLRYAINEGLNQEFAMEPGLTGYGIPEDMPPAKPGPHAVFRQFLNENQFDNYDHEIMSHLTSLQNQGLNITGLEEIMDDPALQSELLDIKDELDIDNVASQLKSLKVAKAKQVIKKKKKAMREKRRARQEVNMKQDMKNLERQGKQEALHRLLITHLQLLCSQQMIDQGRQVLQYYRQRRIRNAYHLKVTDVRVYNTLLHGYASLGLYSHAKKLLNIMAEDNIERNPQTYAAVFECIERSSLEDKHSLLKSYIQEMNEKKITLNDLLDKTKFLYDQRELVLKAVRKIEPYFEPQYTPPFLDYNCSLLETLELDQFENRRGLQHSPAEGVVTLEEIKERGKRQFDIEIKGEIEVENIAVTDNVSDTVKFYRKKLVETESEWREAVKTAFERNLGTLKLQCSASPLAVTLYPYLKVLKEEQFVELIMSEISKLVAGSKTYSATLKLLQRDLGTQVYHKYQIEQYRRNGILKKIEHIYDKYCEWYVKRDSRVPFNGRQAWQDLVHQHRDGASLDIEESPWSMEMRQNVGKFLYNIIINDVKIDVNMFKPKAKVNKLPAVYKLHRPWGRLVRLELKPHPCVARLIAAAARPQLRMRAPLVPTAGPPVPWASHTRGAYLITETPLIRLPTNLINQSKRMEEGAVEQLYPVLDSLNQLGEIPWRINQPVLDLQLKVFRSGGNKKLDIPPPSSSLDLTRFDVATDAASAFKRRITVNKARAEMHSLWCDALYKLSLANHYRNDLFWLPHNMDFRGRVYACPPHISQLGADSARALLMFAKEKPLGPDGLKWLKLHAINLTVTMKKSTIDERLKYSNSIMDKILDSADNPLDGQGWWMESEEPWQTLACCMEIARAVRSPNPEEYMCGFPVHQDGSCNGLQHYAALGGDKAGAAAVNLAPLDRPQDVYSAVAALVEEMRKRDAAAGNQAAVILEGFVRRKVIKQTVMTTVYGVTRFGARLQIAKQLKDIEEFPKEYVWSCSHYLTTKTFDSLREMFTSTKLIQDWFTDCAKVISDVCGESVEWITPLGLPVVQPYYRRPPPSTGNCTNFTDYQQRPFTMKQRNAFPPNFIHSLDSSHMMLTGLHCQAAGITFVSVHDCFWTYPPTVHQMNEICREQFVALHSQPILNDLSDFLVKRYSYAESEVEEGTAGEVNKRRVNSLLQKVPSKGDFDLDSVRRSVYFFS